MRNRITAALFIVSIFAGGIFTLPGILNTEIPSGTSPEALPSLIDTAADESVVGRYALIDLNGLFQRVIGKKSVDDSEADVYRMRNGQLIYGADYISDQAIERYACSVADFAKALDDTPTLFVQLPYKIENGSVMMPRGTDEWANSNANRLRERLLSYNIDTLDLRTESGDAIRFVSQMTDSCNEYSDLFYNTDQHWTNEAALWGAGRVLDKLGCSTGRLSASRFTVNCLSNSFLGSFGKKTGRLYAGTDDYDLVLPAYDTDFDFTIKSVSGDIRRSGSFEDSLLDKRNLTGSLFETNTYETYTGGNYALTVSVNRSDYAKDSPRILLIRDSFSCAMMPFLSLGAKEVTAIDTRYLKSMTALDIAEAGDFDAVVIAYNPSMFGDETFSFM